MRLLDGLPGVDVRIVTDPTLRRERTIPGDAGSAHDRDDGFSRHDY
jgi:hypothetical protein